MKPISYLQTDPQWAGTPYAAPGEKTTIGDSGCGPTCAAMVIATWASRVVTPVVTCQWSVEHGFKALGQGTYYSYFAPQGALYGLDIKQVNWSSLRDMNAASADAFHKQALAAVNDGNYVIACMGPSLWTKSGHFILWYGMNGESVLINDPASTDPARMCAFLERLKKEVKYYFICKKPVERELSQTEAENILMDSAGLSPETVQYLSRDYRFGNPLVIKLATAILRSNGGGKDLSIQEARTLVQKNAGLDDNTMAYIGFYMYSDPLISKLAAVMQ